MATTFRLAGLSGGDLDHKSQDITFRLAVEDGRLLQFVAKIGVAEQISSGLARMATGLRQRKPQAIIAEEVSGYLVKRDAFGGPVLLRLITRAGVPHTFALPAGSAIDIADRLKTESEKHQTSGSA